MPVMGPSAKYAIEDGEFVANYIYPILRGAINSKDQYSTFQHLELARKAITELYLNKGHLKKEEFLDGYGFNAHNKDFNRYVYSLYGFLCAKLSCKVYVDTITHGVTTYPYRIIPENFTFTEQELSKELGSMFFNFDCEDF